jgi:hypothetical protein
VLGQDAEPTAENPLGSLATPPRPRVPPKLSERAGQHLEAALPYALLDPPTAEGEAAVTQLLAAACDDLGLTALHLADPAAGGRSC